jgi:hypothetical protein
MVYLDFANHEAGICPELGRLHGVAEEPELLAPSGEIHVEGDAGAEGRNGELGDLVLADFRVEPLVEMAGHVWANKKSYLSMQQSHREHAAHLCVGIADHLQRALGEERRENP